MTVTWSKKYETLTDLVKKFEFYKGRIANSVSANKLAQLKQEFGQYLDVETAMGQGESFERGTKNLQTLKILFDKQVLIVEKVIASKFKKVYKSKVNIKKVPVLEKKKKDLFDLCLEYESLADVGLLKQKDHDFNNKKISNFALFFREGSKVDNVFEILAKQYASAFSKDELLIVLDKAVKQEKEYRQILKEHSPFWTNKSSPYNCEQNIHNTRKFIKEVKATIKNYDKNEFLRKTLAKYDGSLKSVVDPEKAAKEYIVSSLRKITVFNEQPSIKQGIDDLNLRKEKIRSLNQLTELISKKISFEKTLSELEKREDYLSETVQKEKNIIEDIQRLQQGDLVSLTVFKHTYDKKNPYLKQLALDYEVLYQKISHAREEQQKQRFASDYPLLSEAAYNLPIYIEHMEMPDNPDFFDLRETLLGMQHKNWMDRFKSFGEALDCMKPAENHHDIDYLKRIGSMIEKSTTWGMIHQEIKMKKENQGIVKDALQSLYTYVRRSEQQAEALAVVN